MNVLGYLQQLLTQGAELTLLDGSLKLKAAKGAVTPEQLTVLKEKKPKIIELFNELEMTSSRDFEYLSYSQKRLWVIERITPMTGQYNMPAQVEINGALDLAKLQHCLDECLARHAVLRSNYRQLSDGSQVQVMRPACQLPISQWDLSDLAGEQQQQKLMQIGSEQASKGFDLTKDLMLRAGLIKLAADKHVLFINMHHIASDGISRGIIVSELARLYRGENLPPLKLQYADYAHWQNNWYQQQPLATETEFWQQQLQDMPWVHNLPLDRPRLEQGGQQALAAGYHQQAISHDVVSGLNQLAANNQATLFMLLHTAFSLLLHRYSGDRDVIVGTPVANREQLDLANVVGFFANTLILRLQIEGDERFDTLLAQSKDYLLKAFEHQQMPFEKLVEVLQPPRDMSHGPLVQVMLSFQSKQDAKALDTRNFEMDGLSMRSIEVRSNVAKFDILLHVQEVENDAGELSLGLNWEYASGLFDASTIEAMASQFDQLLQAIVKTPEQSVDALPMLTPAQHQTMVVDWNQSQLNHPYQQCIEQLFINTVVATPDSIAIVDEHGEMSYIALYEQAQALADELSQLDIAIEQLVAVRLAKGREQVVATLAIMMAGGAYLPLECDWPDTRCGDILSRSNTQLMIANSDDSLAPQVSLVSLDKVKHLSGSDKAALLARARDYQPKQQPQDLAYVIFTSGSTGVPKGVAIEHQSAVNTLLDINAQYQVDDKDRVLAVSALSFDLSVYDFFGLLSVGGMVVFPQDKQAKNPQHWFEMTEQHGITIWNTVPTSAGLLASEYERQKAQGRSEFNAPITLVMMSGDWIDPKLPARLWQALPQSRLYSLGGATEGSIWSINYPIKQDTSHLRSIPYGKPLNGQAFYILNSQLQHTPVGVTGELFIGGVGVAREYYGQSDLTARQFIDHPQLNQRLYRTGDQGRYRTDGNIEFMGRVDNQLKIRGFRIEPGEIETQLGKHPDITKVVVLAKKDESGNQFLVAYFTHSQRKPDIAELRDFINGTIPVYMMPSAFMAVSQFPLTANGKLDIKSLPEVDFAAQKVAYQAPTTEVEIALCDMTQTLLALEQVGLGDNFFALGGHSILALQLNSMILARFGVELATTDFFNASSMAQLAEKLEQQIAVNANLQMGQAMADAEDMNEMEW